MAVAELQSPRREVFTFSDLDRSSFSFQENMDNVFDENMNRVERYMKSMDVIDNVCYMDDRSRKNKCSQKPTVNIDKISKRLSSGNDLPDTQFSEDSKTHMDGNLRRLSESAMQLLSPKRTILSKYSYFMPEPPSETVSTAPPDSDEFYNMNVFPRGKVIIINNKYFEERSGMGDYTRKGTDKDAAELVDVFLELGFVVHRHDDVNKKEMHTILKDAARNLPSDTGCFVCCILSHGEEGTVYATDGQVELKSLTSLFHKSKLHGRPKLFLVQACQGHNLMDSNTVEADGIDSVDAAFKINFKSREEFKDVNLTIPIEADYLFAHATVNGYYAWRHSVNGSWFIQAICEVFRKYAHKMDIMRMMTRVNALMVKNKSNTGVEHTTGRQQIAQIMTQLRKDLYFFPPYGPLKPKALYFP